MEKKKQGSRKRERGEGGKTEKKVTCCNRKERKKPSFSRMHVGSMLHKDFFVVVLLDKGLLPRERRWWHHLNWLSLCPGETKASSHPGGVRPLRGKGPVVCVSVCICVLCALCPYMCVFVCGNLASPFILYGFWSNIANIVAEGELHKETMECGPHVCKSGYRSLTAFSNCTVSKYSPYAGILSSKG